MITAERYHDISCGHRVFGQGGKCENLHGHNYRIHFVIEAITPNGVDKVGRVLDFSVIKSELCMWLEENWDHKFLIWVKDPWAASLYLLDASLVMVEFNPTAENMAAYLTERIAPMLLNPYGVRLIECKIEETRKCSATYKTKA